jgi:hypothetical protein
MDKDILVCQDCGGKNVQTLVWVDSNTNAYKGEGTGDNYCEDCQEHVYLNTEEEYKLNKIEK